MRYCICNQGSIWVFSPSQDLLLEASLHGSPIIGVSSYKSFLISASEDSEVRSYDIETKKSQQLYSHISEITAFDLHPSGLVATSSDNVLKVYNLETRNVLEDKIQEKVSSLKFVSDKLLAIGDRNGLLKVVSIAQLDDVKFSKKLHKERIKHLALSPDGKLLATSSYDKSGFVLDSTNFQELHTIQGHGDWVRCSVFSRDSKKLFSYGDDKKIIEHLLAVEDSEFRFRNWVAVMAVLVVLIGMVLYRII